MNKWVGFFSLVLFLVVFSLWLSTTGKQNKFVNILLFKRGQVSLDHSQQTQNQQSATQPPNQPSSRVQQFLLLEQKRVGLIDPSPNETQQRLQRFAQSLDLNELNNLMQIVLNRKQNNDLRFLSVYLLSMSQLPEVEGLLESVALSEIDKSLSEDSRLYDEELMMRTQALEGLAARAASASASVKLQNFLRRQDNVFLLHQARRLLQASGNDTH